MPRYIDAEQFRFDLQKHIVEDNNGMRAFVDTDFISLIDDCEAEDVVEVKYGRWERTDDGAARCTSCKQKMYPYLYGYAYCPLCGASMNGGEQDENNKTNARAHA